MQREPTSEGLAQKALELLNETDKLEEEKNWIKAIEKYKQAAECLKESGYLTHRIQDIYERITEINNYLSQEKEYLEQTQQAQTEQLQNKAFILLDDAKKLELDGFFEDAIQKYMSSIKLLVESGWTETQLENLKSRIIILAQNLEKQELIQKQKEIAYTQQRPQVPIKLPHQPSSETTQIGADQKTQKLKAYEKRKKQEEEMQNNAFAYIDEAKEFEKEKKFDDALKKYQKATEILKSLGWTQQTQNIDKLIKKLQIQKENYINIQSQQKKPETTSIKEDFTLKSTMVQPIEDLKEKRLIEFEKKKKYEEDIQTEAFNLIDIGKRLEREKKYNEAINHFKKSINLLEMISWDSYVQPITNFINDIQKKQEREFKAEQIKKKRDDERNKLQKTIHEKQKEQFIQTAQDLELKRKEFERKRAEEIEKEKRFFAVLNEADQILEEKNDYDNAILKYQKALEILKNLESGWETYIPTIKTTIYDIKQRQEYKAEMESELKKRKEESRKKETEFQTQITKQIKLEREKLKQKEFELKLRDDELKYREQRKQNAFKYLDAAQHYIKEGDFDKAIYAYQNAGNIFAEIQWTDELPLIENAIKELEAKKSELNLAKQKKMQETIETKRREKEFQKQITKQLQIEREKLKQREIALREYEKELEYREKRKKEAFKLLEEAQNYLRKGDFDMSVELYRSTANIFAEIQWHDEINLIQNSLIEIENKKREDRIRKQLEFQGILERERQENLFQEQLAGEMKTYRESLKIKEIVLREKEKELEYREKRKEEAFKLLDYAHDLLSQRKFDQTIEIYHNIANIFAQIQWIDEISIIENAIKEIENKKKEKEMWRHKSIQKAIQRETTHYVFVEEIKFQRNLEKAKLMEKQELIEKQKELTSQNLARQEEAFKLIDEGDVLLKNEDFDKAIEKYQKASSLLSIIGWEPGYLNLLQENFLTIQSKKIENEKEKQLEKEILVKQLEEEQEFQLEIAEKISREKEKMRIKKIEILQQEAMKTYMEKRKSKAFDLMDGAETLLNEGNYEKSIKKYRQAELILNEIQFPTGLIKDTIIKVKKKQKMEDLAKQKEIEKQLKEEQQEFLFQRQTAEKIQKEKEKMKIKQIKIKEQEELKSYMEKRKEDSFNLLEEAEIFLNQTQYDKALDFYHSAELILNEIQYPTESIKEMINKVREKKKEQEILKQKKLESEIQKEKENREFLQKIDEFFEKEKERLKLKQIQIEEREKMQVLLEKKKDQAFSILDDAENFIRGLDYDRALECYRKAELILHELHFSRDAINDMVNKVLKLKKQKENEKELDLIRELERLEEEEELQALVEERRRQEAEKKIAQQLAVKEREKIIQEQMNQREAAYSLLEEGGKYLKGAIPDYDKAISLYIQARNFLAENIGWEPEIYNLNELIKDLQLEKTNFIKKKRLEAQSQLQRQKEYDAFQETMRKERTDYEKQKELQKEKLKEYEEKKKNVEEIRDKTLKLIDEGKRCAEIEQFDKAYLLFERAITNFKEIGWNEQIHYIETEIKNTKILEEKFKHDELEIKEIRAELESQRKQELQQILEEDHQKMQVIEEASNLSREITTLIESRTQKLGMSEQKREELIKQEAKEFSRNMGKILQLKQELFTELGRTKEEEKRKLEEIQKTKDREELDEIARMLKEVAKKEKK